MTTIIIIMGLIPTMVGEGIEPIRKRMGIGGDEMERTSTRRGR